ncbi:MAG: putative O-glycosylation ligase, exosortase A system-associated, partial [Magnetospirillum sp.]|nr:putative O-glycosylation ligase, exosortase A system-associated [Magnetospirillum sp.]
AAVPAVRLGLWGGLGLCIVSVVAAFSRGGFIGLVVVALGFIAASRRKLRNLALLAALGLALLPLAPAAWFERINTIQDADEDTSFMSRVGAWKLSLVIALDRPLLGGGFNALQDPEVWHALRASAAARDVLPDIVAGEEAHAAHSIFFQVLGDLGFPGLILFLALLGSGLRNAAAVKRACRGRPELAWAADLAAMLQLSILAYVAAGAALSMAYFELYYVVLALLSALRRTVEAPVCAPPAGSGSPAAARPPSTAPGRRPATAHRAAGRT